MANVLVLCPPSVKNHCLNGGTCYMTHNNTRDKICSCTLPYFGSLCDKVYSASIDVNKVCKQELDRVLTTAGIIIAFTVLFLIFLISWYISWRRKRDYLLWRQNASLSKESKSIQVNTIAKAALSNSKDQHTNQGNPHSSIIKVDRASNTSPSVHEHMKISTFNHNERLPSIANSTEMLETYDNVPMMELNHQGQEMYRQASNPLSMSRTLQGFSSQHSMSNAPTMVARRSNSNVLGFDYVQSNLNHRVAEPQLVHSYMNPMTQIPLSHNSLPKVWMDNRPILKVASEHDALLHDLRERGSNHSYY